MPLISNEANIDYQLIFDMILSGIVFSVRDSATVKIVSECVISGIIVGETV